jgi:short-subunit dehydrogenase
MGTEKKVAAITGASRGIEARPSVSIGMSRIDREVRRWNASGGRGRSQRQGGFRRIETLPRADVCIGLLVNNAGVGTTAPLLGADVD